MQSNNRLPLKVVHKYECNAARECEAALHDLFSHVHERGEWYRLTQMHMDAIKVILKPLRRDKHVGCKQEVLAGQEHEREVKRRKHNFEKATRSYLEVASEDEIRDVLSACFQPREESVKFMGQSELRTQVRWQMAPVFKMLDPGFTKPEDQERLMRLLQYRLFSKMAWLPAGQVSPEKQSMILGLQKLFDPRVDNALGELLAELGLASVLPPPLKDQKQKTAADDAQKKLRDEGYRVPESDYIWKGFIRYRIPLLTFKTKNEQLLRLCAAVVQCAGMPPFMGKQGKLSSVHAVRSLVTGLFGIRVRKNERYNGEADEEKRFFWLETDFRVLCWLRDFEEILNST
jgi:hypothetical protein